MAVSSLELGASYRGRSIALRFSRLTRCAGPSPSRRSEGGHPSSVFPDQLVIRLEQPEAAVHGWRPGFFVSHLHAQTAKGRLDIERGRHKLG